MSNILTTLCPVGTIAEALDVTPQRVQQLVKEGVIPKDSRGRYELKAAVHGYLKYLKARQVGAEREHGTMAEQNLRLMTAKADIAEAEAKRLAGALVPVDDVARVWSDAVTRFRQRSLAIPSKTAPLVAVETEPDACQDIVETFVHEALAELAATEVRIVVGKPGDRGPAAGRVRARRATASADRERVGRPIPEAQLGE